ncbi:MAG: hypothetical protein A6F71_04765 [Cycloclasticus sp. symbiont of Poecilosclerida sp. M]|nr:MAG: hypothetical protein A6F71_04765 [Cycloclasticus sp. symbiont of Poecilosclerida sp. M]
MEDAFITPEREKSLKFLLQLLDTSQKAVLLRGPNRSGKTFFLRRLQHHIKRDWKFYKIDKADVASGGDPIRLWTMAINESLGGKHSLESRVMLWSRMDKTAIIVVEDVHTVSREALYDLGS